MFPGKLKTECIKVLIMFYLHLIKQKLLETIHDNDSDSESDDKDLHVLVKGVL